MNGITFGGWYTKYQPSAPFLSNGQGIGEPQIEIHLQEYGILSFRREPQRLPGATKVIAACDRSALAMIPYLFSADLFEYQEIFASPIATSVFIYATAALLLINLSFASLYSRYSKRPRAIRFNHRTI
jgi:hypothetical protein